MTLTERLVADEDARNWLLTARAQGIGAWRGRVTDVMRRWHLPEPAQELGQLGVTELLTNVTRHVADPECRLLLARLPELAIVQVLDRSSAFPVVGARPPDPEADAGRGLWLLSRMATDFGCFRHVWDDGTVGKSVWFAIRCGDDAEC
ncbi:ATP-binding protein [Streptomyces profundus]|uniref:ATP-binding protein n=1 Tax=Streptomyces profundus TaxID=2867410 RepID=UPI001D16023B|nr:ATP-binding protein [Streptomyces sp. MA3_2.13]UED84876.1 ATP-binding protein [Streptomyces sp. MA3_2.13]